MSIRGLPLCVTVPFREAAFGAGSGGEVPALGQFVMFTWDSVFEWGRRASDKPAPAPAMLSLDPLLESVIVHEQIEVQYQPIIEPATGRVVGAEALARAAIARSAESLFERAATANLDGMRGAGKGANPRRADDGCPVTHREFLPPSGEVTPR